MQVKPAHGNLILALFEWWNSAYQTGAFTPEGFANFFTDDAPFIVGGALRGRGPKGVCAHFQAILEATEDVVLVLPVKETLVSSEVGFVHYQVTAQQGGQKQVEDCLAVAHFRHGQIASFEVIGRQVLETL